ncbi:hypothetical protein GW17_00036677 [Ensete ventricosum]|nr:hypothetical protein GW17_00036677 [Ensete ventricosum]RZS24781.1 hypothetical protein BHM03_00057889 [Ensete ventricosum]
MAFSSVIRRRLWPRLSSPWRSLHEGPDTIDELLDRHLVKKSPNDNDELASQRRLTSTRREVLSLYRDVLRASRFFAWPDARGVPWREVLRENARREFEEARFERDPEVVARLLIGGRDAVQKALDKLVEGSKKRVEAEEQQLRDGGGR